MAKARELIDANQYVLDSDWGDVQPRADAQNAFLENHSWDDYARWHLGLTEGANDETKARYAFVYGDFAGFTAPGLIACVYRALGVAAQGRRGGRARSAAVPRRQDRAESRRARAGT